MALHLGQTYCNINMLVLKKVQQGKDLKNLLEHVLNTVQIKKNVHLKVSTA